jgi:hypothetical protein
MLKMKLRMAEEGKEPASWAVAISKRDLALIINLLEMDDEHHHVAVAALSLGA